MFEKSSKKYFLLFIVQTNQNQPKPESVSQRLAESHRSSSRQRSASRQNEKSIRQRKKKKKEEAVNVQNRPFQNGLSLISMSAAGSSSVLKTATLRSLGRNLRPRKASKLQRTEQELPVDHRLAQGHVAEVEHAKTQAVTFHNQTSALCLLYSAPGLITVSLWKELSLHLSEHSSLYTTLSFLNLPHFQLCLAEDNNIKNCSYIQRVFQKKK